jgi:hypothetical protein
LELRQGNAAFGLHGVITSQGLQNGFLHGDLSLNRFLLSLNDTMEIQTGNSSIKIQTRLDSSFIPSLGDLSGFIDKSLNGSLNLKFSWMPLDPQNTSLENLRIRGKIHGDSLDLAQIPVLSSQINGHMNFDIEFGIEKMEDFFLHLQSTTDSLSYPFGETLEKIPSIYISSDLYARTQQFQNWYLDSAFFRIPDLLNLQLTGHYFAQDQNIGLSLQKVVIQNSKIPNFLPKQMKKSMGDISLTGEEHIMMDLEAHPETEGFLLQVDGKLLFKDVDINLPGQSLNAQGILGNLSIHGPLDRHHGECTLGFKELSYPHLRQAPVSDGNLGFNWTFMGFDSLCLEKGEIDLETLGLKSTFKAEMISSSEVNMSAEAEVVFHSEDIIEMMNGMRLWGGFSAQVKGKIGNSETQKMNLSGSIQMNSLCFSQGESILIEGIQGLLPLEMSMDIEQKRFIPRERFRYPPADEYEVQRHLYQSLFPQLGSLNVDKIKFDRYQFTDLKMDVDMGSGFSVIPWFRVGVFDGNFGGSLGLNYGSGTPEEITYEIRAHASRINSATLIEEVLKKEEETELNATMSFQGKGIDLEAGIDLDGYFHLTQIGPQFASTLLRGMDPKGSDRSIRLTRRLLDMGWKPKLFSFELRHGYVYPSLVLSQPWFSPIRLPRELKYGRLPLNFFLNPK